MYRLQLVHPEPPMRRRSSWNPLLRGESSAPDAEGRSENVNDVLTIQYTPEQLRSEVEAYFPRNGGRIEPLLRSGQGPSRRDQRYVVTDRHGNVRRILFVDRTGRIFEERQYQDQDETLESSEESNSIKLGLVSLQKVGRGVKRHQLTLPMRAW
jgi:hypothetical protein